MRIAGVVLVVLGLVALVSGGIPYNKTENVARIGDFKMAVTEKKQMTVPPLLSGLAILAGAAMYFGAGRKRGA